MAKPDCIAVTNQKGGVGKTTIAINVAGALNTLDRDVLLVDLDPQGAATEGLGFLDEYNAQPPSLFDVLTEPEDRDLIEVIILNHEEMDLIPSNIDMTAAEPELTLSRRGGEQLKLALESIDRVYDYVITSGLPCDRCGSREWVATPDAESVAVCAICDYVTYDKSILENSW